MISRISYVPIIYLLSYPIFARLFLFIRGRKPVLLLRGGHTSVKKGVKTMAHVISDDCVKCGACKETCPCEAISEGDTKLVVDPDKCVDCGACEGACPTGAIKAAE